MSNGTVTFVKEKGMRIQDLLGMLVTELIEDRGHGCEVTAQEICQMMHDRFGTNPGSVIPSDYCYNRVNYGINVVTKPTFFEYVDRDIYRCLGACPYEGPVMHRPKGERADIQVGVCENGKRHIFPEYKDLLSRHNKK